MPIHSSIFIYDSRVEFCDCELDEGSRSWLNCGVHKTHNIEEGGDVFIQFQSQSQSHYGTIGGFELKLSLKIGTKED